MLRPGSFASRPVALTAPLAVLALLIGLLAGSTHASAAFPGGNGSLLYYADGQIYKYDSGTGATLLGYGYSPRYSPDGTRIAYWNYGGGQCDLWVMNADGSGQTKLTNATACDYQSPAWSADGTQLAFVRTPPDGNNSSIGLIASDGSSETIVASAPPGGYYLHPAWSPDGARIAFSGSTTYHGNQDIYLINPDGTGLTNLTATPGDREASFHFPSWAPDGSQLVFTQGAGGQEGVASPGIYAMNADGTNLHPLLFPIGCGAVAAVSWSPDGQRIGYSARTDSCSTGAIDIYSMDPDGSDRTLVHGTNSDLFLTDWQPAPPGGPVSVPPAPPPGTTLRQVQGFDVAPDGTTAMMGVLTSDPDYGQADIFVSGSGGSFARITYDSLAETGPSIANDHRIAYAPGGQTVVVRNGDGTGRVQLAEMNSSCGYTAPGIAPDGSFVVYSNYCQGTFRVDSDGSDRVQLGPSNLFFYTADITPDGTRIAGECYESTTFEAGICTMNADGTNPQLVLPSTGDYAWMGGSWSPDGTQLAAIKYDYTAQTTEIHVANADGSGLQTVPVAGTNFKYMPRWLADGRIGYVYYTASDGSTSEIRFAASPVSPDQDGDGVANDIDSGTGTWNDGDGTTGSIASVDAGVTATVVDAADAAEGVEISVTGSSGFARFVVCGFTVKLSVGTTAVFTCGSIEVRVISGQAEVVLSSDTSVSVPSGVTATIEDTGSGRFAITEVSGGSVTVTMEGQTTSVSQPTSLAAWTFVGFAQPVDNGGVLNVANAGAAVPLKWRLLDATGSPVTNLTAAAVSVAGISCSNAAPTDTIEQVAAAGSGLTNLGDGYYQLNWKTNKAFAGTCKRMKLDLGEGITRDALFKFVR
jgi:Tol biopolymer transport system component